MSTRGAITRVTGDGFEGRYNHSDSYVTGLGKQLWELYHTVFNCNLEAMLTELIDNHPAGWSTLYGDWSQKPGFIEYKSKYDQEHPSHIVKPNGSYEWLDGNRRPQCYCHGDRNEEEQTITHKDAADCGCEYVYAFARDYAERPIMNILSSYCEDGAKMIGMFGSGDPNAHWKTIVQVYLDDEEPDWDLIEGE